MFWKKKQPAEKQGAARSDLPAAPEPKTEAQRLNEAATALAASLKTYSEAAYRASQHSPDAELQAAHSKWNAAHRLVTEGRVAHALGRSLPQHMESWPFWIEREDFKNYVGLAASDINANRTKESDSVSEINVSTIEFTFKDVRYRLIIRNRGYRTGEVELFTGNEQVAKFDILKKEAQYDGYTYWEFMDVRALKVGQWMQDVLDMAAQIDSLTRRDLDKLRDDRAREAARDIDLG